MDKISDIFSSDHRHCDNLFSRSENHVHRQELRQAQIVFSEFVEAIERHFSKEENVLFPELVKRTPIAAGPVQVMRAEHEDMRWLIEELQEVLRKQDSKRFLGTSETLLIMMQQHNTKEENILYKMADEVVGADAEKILSKDEQAG